MMQYYQFKVAVTAHSKSNSNRHYLISIWSYERWPCAQ